ncbi:MULTISPECIES: FAD-dependent thymidylate synthase [Prosthecochloris]|uniref:FAD-dependent thymidylate synthase n=1 Tax=Prosthecochloris vibrioformis TaxID=1098 RepID=A0A5C4S5I9_PROVB|nr:MULTISPECIES: FAD-dependent thymidylate synthase [Prosthecochloris]ANT65660.1 Thymidylate synthase ThyX [Prosthecochloris sp. CIB 2401]TNJ37961.1 FAD-dependent thymidylate synthase [Prosthecochloris vibrioformis]
MNVRLLSVTKPVIDIEGHELTPEGLIAYCARVSSPQQENPDYEHLLRYCIRNRHWSIFEMADMTVEITTSRAISPQILRHKSFCFQEFSQRYARVQAFETIEPRRQDTKNRQNSISDLDQETLDWFSKTQDEIIKDASKAYDEALDKGIAKECARMLLPLSTQTRLYMKGSVRSWIHYLEVRLDKGTQKEHRDIAQAILVIFRQEFPAVAKALDW